MMTIGDTIEAKANADHMTQVKQKLGNADAVVQMFLKNGDTKSAETTIKTTLRLTDEADLKQIMAEYRKGATVRMAGVKMPERMAAMPEDAKFTEIKAAGKEKISVVLNAMNKMATSVRNFILQRGNPRVTPAY